MAKEATSTRALTGPRILNQPVPPYQGTFDAGAYPGAKGWETFNAGVYYENYFDLSGYELDDLTAFPTGIMLQDGMPVFANGTLPADFQLVVFDIVSQERLSANTIYDEYLTGNYPSSSGSKQDWSQILMCNVRMMLPQSDFTSASQLLTASAGAFGSNEPTAVQKLWTYRILIIGGLDLTGVEIAYPATRFVLNAVIAKEDDLEYMMRLKRSYELSTQG